MGVKKPMILMTVVFRIAISHLRLFLKRNSLNSKGENNIKKCNSKKKMIERLYYIR